MKKMLSIAVALTFLGVMAVRAADDAAAEAAAEAKVKQYLASINYQSGVIPLGSGLATLNVSEKFRYVSPADAAKILLLWGNPPTKEKPLGMLFPAQMRAESTNGWAVLIEWVADGYVKDDDAEKIDYADMMKDLKASVHESNAERVKEGYPSIELVGWATPPRYDKVTHKLYWAKEIKFDGASENTLNYDLRILGRKGVLVLSVISDISRLAEIEAVSPELLAMVDFNAGERYADFKPGSDKYATYGIAALIAGGVAAKAGLFKGLIIAILAAKKFIILGAVALFAFIGKLFKRRKEKEPDRFTPGQ